MPAADILLHGEEGRRGDGGSGRLCGRLVAGGDRRHAGAASQVVIEDTLEQLITETPMPRAADAYFDDFIFNFTANKRLQFERIVFPLRVTEADGKTRMTEKSQWKMEHLFMRQGYYTLLFDDDDQMSHMKDSAVNEAIVEKIMLKKNKVKNYFFHRVRGAWMMYEVRTTPVEENANASFLTFYKRFTTDSVFQVQSINETVEFVGPDPDCLKRCCITSSMASLRQRVTRRYS